MPSVRDARRERERGREPHDFAQRLFTGLPRRYDVLEDVLSLGQNRRWRREMLDHVVPADPAQILDVATGTAGVALELVAQTAGRVVGVDVTDAMLRRGQVNVARADAPDRVQLVLGTAERLPFPDATFDALTFTYLLRYVSDPRDTLRELARVLKPGAPMASLEFHVPPNPFWRCTRAACCPPRVPSPDARGSTSDGSWARTSLRTTAPIRSRRRSPPGATPAWRASTRG